MKNQRSHGLLITSMARFCILKIRESGKCSEQDLKDCGFFESEITPYYVTAYCRALRWMRNRKEKEMNAILTTTEVKRSMTESLHQMLISKHSKDPDELQKTLLKRGFKKEEIQQFFKSSLDDAEAVYSQTLLKAI